MENNYVSPSPTVLWERVGSEVVVLNTLTNTTHHLTGDLAKCFVAIAYNTPAETTHISTLAELGLIHTPPPLTRRRVVQGVGAGVGLGIATLALPLPAAASSQNTAQPSSNPPSSSPPAPPEPVEIDYDPAAGLWRWQVNTFGPQAGKVSVSPTANPPIATGGDFTLGETWTITLIAFPTITETAVVISDGGSGLDLIFNFDGLTQPQKDSFATDGVQLSNTETTPTRVSKVFTVPEFSF